MGTYQPATEYSRVARMGANTVYLDVYWEADSPDANTVHRYEGTADGALISNIKAAQAEGLRVVLMPKVYCNGCPGGWRGYLKPSDPHQFFESYRGMVTEYATLAQQHGVWLFFLGSEMSTLQSYGDEWRQTAASVRNVYSGLITYQPNWDTYSQSMYGVSFWDALDVVAVSSYYPLTSTPQPSVAQLKQAWHSSNTNGFRGQNWFGVLQNLAAATGKNVLIGEVGYRSTTTAAAFPYDETPGGTADQSTQANAYQALLETFTPQPWFMGVIWWQWRGDGTADGNTDMTPKGKQAEAFLTQWWAQGWRPVPGQDASAARPTSGAGTAARAAARPVAGVTRSATAATTPGTAATNTTGANTSTTGQGVVNSSGSDAAAAAINGPGSVARLAGHSADRGLAVAIALVGLLGVGAGVTSVGLRTVRPRTLF